MVVIEFAKADPYLQGETIERGSQQADSDREKNRGSKLMPDTKKRAGKTDEKKQGRTNPASERQVYGIVKKLRSPLQTWNIGFEMNAVDLVIANSIQIANAAENMSESRQQNRNKSGDRTEKKRRRGRLRYELGELV